MRGCLGAPSPTQLLEGSYFCTLHIEFPLPSCYPVIQSHLVTPTVLVSRKVPCLLQKGWAEAFPLSSLSPHGRLIPSFTHLSPLFWKVIMEM